MKKKMTKEEAIDIVKYGDKHTNEELQTARDIITEAINDNYILVNKNSLIKLLNTMYAGYKAKIKNIYEELTK